MQQPPPYGFSGRPTLPGGYPPVPPPVPPRKRTVWQRFHSARKRTQWGLGCATLVLILCLCICSSAAVGAAGGPQKAATLDPTATTAAQLTHVTLIAATAVPTQAPTVVRIPTATPIPKPTTISPVAPTQPPIVPTPLPTQAPAPTQPPQPTQPPPTGTNGNPWGYSFVPGNLIYSPAAGFCSYFGCVSTFWTATHGYVVECANGLYSHSGGVRGACSRDGGPSAILYSH